MSDEPFKPLSRRLAEEKGELSDIFIYDKIPDSFRNRFCHLFVNTIQVAGFIDDTYRVLEAEGAKVLGLPELGSSRYYRKNITDFIQKHTDSSTVLDLIEFYLYKFYFDLGGKENPNTTFGRAISETNHWFQYDNLGYRFENGQIVRIDNQIIYREALQPALKLLSDPRFAGANQEMLAAYDSRRNGNNADALTNANKAFESVIKSICEEKGYTYDKDKDAAKKLIDILKTEGFFPAYMNPHIDGIRITLETGLPVVRNKKGGHGQGQAVTPVPDEYVGYALNLAATNIVFLARLLIDNP